MAYILQLKHLITNELIPDVEDHIDELFEGITNSKEPTAQERLDLEEMQALRDEYKELLKELNSGEIDEEEAQQLYTELTAMREGGDDEDDLYFDDEDEDDEDDYDEFDIDNEDENY
jgi:hypothetical protein